MPAKEPGQRLHRPPVARPNRELTHDNAPTKRAPAFVVVRSDAVVAYVGVSEGDHLACVRRVRQHFLVTRHERVEHDLASGGGGATDGGATDGGATDGGATDGGATGRLTRLLTRLH